MLQILYVLTALSLVFVVFTLIMGASSMGKSTEASREKSNKWMWRRVGAQIFAILMVVLTVWVRNKSGG